MDSPKLFISYRWSSPEHSDWVLSLATSLRSDGIDVKLDRWDLRPGHDALAFMEGMVTDQSISKVLVISDRGYVDRANNRDGGVGIEAQIISPKVYASTNQEKFAAVLLELDEDGRPLLPTFLASRIYFDFTTPEAQSRSYEEIVRWCFDKPIDVRPPVGKQPAYLESEERSPIQLGKLLQSQTSVVGSAANADANDVLHKVGLEAGNLVLELVTENDQPEAAYQAILATVPVRERVFGALRTTLRSSDPKKMERIHSFFESVSKYWDYRPSFGTFSPLDNDALRYFLHDCFVGFVALALDEGMFPELAEFLSTPYFRPDLDGRTGKTALYTDFRPYLESLELRNRIKNLRRISLHADVLSETHQQSIISFASFLEADFVLYVRGLLIPKYDWYPITGIWLAHSHGALRIFARAESAKYYDKISPIFFGRSSSDLRTGLQPYVTGQEKTVRFDYRSLSLERLMNLDNLATSS